MGKVATKIFQTERNVNHFVQLWVSSRNTEELTPLAMDYAGKLINTTDAKEARLLSQILNAISAEKKRRETHGT